MKRVAVKSSNVVSVGYDPQSQVLEVEFHGGSVYRYRGVPAEQHEKLMQATSVGGYLSAHIKGVYAFERGTAA